MPRTTIGNLDVRLGVEATQFFNTFKRARSEQNRFVANSRRMNSQIGGFSLTSKKAQRGFLELSRGVEDFAAVVGTTGLAGGLRASSNNFSQFAAILSPMAGAIAGVGIAIGTIAIPMLLRMGKTAKTVKADFDQLNKSITLDRRRAQGELRIGGLEAGLRDTIESRISELRGRGQVNTAALAGIEAKRRGLANTGILTERERRGFFGTIFERVRLGLTEGLQAEGSRAAEFKLTDAALEARKELGKLVSERAKVLADQAGGFSELRRLEKALQQRSGAPARPGDLAAGFAFQFGLERAAVRARAEQPGSLTRRLRRPFSGVRDFGRRAEGFARGFTPDFLNLVNAGATVLNLNSIRTLTNLIAGPVGNTITRKVEQLASGIALPRTAPAILGGTAAADIASRQRAGVSTTQVQQKNTNKIVKSNKDAGDAIIDAIQRAGSLLKVASF